MTNIIDFPNVNELRDEVKILRDRLMELAFDHDDLLAHRTISVEAKYNDNFGLMEYKEMNLNLTYKKLKEEKRLIEEYLAKDEVIDFKYISEVVSKKFVKDENLLSEKLGRINDIYDFINHRSLSARDFMDLNKAYKKIIEKINPLVNPNISEEEWDLYVKASIAFTNHHLSFLTGLASMLDNINLDDYFLFTPDLLYAEKKRLEAGIVAINKTIEGLYDDYPLNLNIYLEDKRAFNKKKSVLEKKIESLEVAIRTMEEEIKGILESIND
ncbi:hypothetical protein [Anaerococcus tetradius]|uniref:hypothetical protein n=1 Tax=Anaerococcus tetradius TaxID=33036 RepID=UPI0023F2F137|nr:hypothetical protein [Anaerococcus tetradius]